MLLSILTHHLFIKSLTIFVLEFIINLSFMKGFGFPGNNTNNGSNTPYRADTSKKKSELIDVLKRSETLWNAEGKQ